MVSERFLKFLKEQARRSPIRVDGAKISWEDGRERRFSSKPSDMLGSLYLGEKLKETVVMERGVAAMLKHRLSELEKENIRQRGTIRILKFIIAGLAVIIILLLWRLFTV